MVKKYAQNVGQKPLSETVLGGGKQRYFCKSCSKHFVLPRNRLPTRLSKDYISGKQTLSQLADKYGVSVSTIQRRLREIHSTRIISKDKEVVVLMDATYWGHSFGVLLFKDAKRGNVLWRKFLDGKEVLADYLEGVEWLEQHRFDIKGVVCDGLRGLPQALSRYEVQYCQFHQVKTVKKHLTNKPKTQAGIELKAIALVLCHTDKESFGGALNEWYERCGNFIKERTKDEKTGRMTYTHRRLRSAYFSLKHNMTWL